VDDDMFNISIKKVTDNTNNTAYNAYLESDADGLSLRTAHDNTGFRLAKSSGTRTNFKVLVTMTKNSGSITATVTEGGRVLENMVIIVYLSKINFWGT
jgi:hypothetical protein